MEGSSATYETKYAGIKEHPDDTSIECYVHTISPVKKVENSNRKYFYCSLQAKDKAYRAVCFSPEKQTELHTIEKVKSPIKLQNYRLTNDEEILLDKFTKITPVDKEQIGFEPVIFTTTGLVQNISSLDKLASEQLVSLKAQVASVSGIKYVDTRGGRLKKQEIVIRDPTTSIKVTLWQEYVDTLEVNKTYELRDLRLKVYRNNRYLNTPKTEKFTFKESEPFQQPLVEVDKDLTAATSETWSARIMGIQQSSKELSCISCTKNVVPKEDGVIGDCVACKMMQVLTSCSSIWFMRMMVQNTAKPEQKQRLTFYHQHIQKLLEKLQVILDLNVATDKDILMAIVQANKIVDITFDTITNRVTNI